MSPSRLNAAAVIEAVGVPVAATDPDGVIIAWNDLAASTLGIAAVEALGKPLQWFYSACQPERDAGDALVRACAREAVVWEGRVLGGTRRPWCHASLRAILDGDHCTGFVETWRDLSRAGGAHARLAEVERLARLGTWEWDVQRDEILWSDGLYAIYGLTPEEFDPRFAAREQRVHPDDHDRVAAVMGRALETGSDIEIDYRIIRPDGRVRTIHGRAETIFDDRGKPIRMLGTAQDVTEVRAAEDALERTAMELGRRAAELHRVTRGNGGHGAVADLLSPRQLEILSLVADGLTNTEISERLFLSESTVKWHVRQILDRLGVSNRAQAVARFLA